MSFELTEGVFITYKAACVNYDITKLKLFYFKKIETIIKNNF